MSFDKNTIRVGATEISELNFPVGSTPTDIKKVYNTGSTTSPRPILVWKKTDPYYILEAGFDYYTNSSTPSNVGYSHTNGIARYINDNNASSTAQSIGDTHTGNPLPFPHSPMVSGSTLALGLGGFIANSQAGGGSTYYLFVTGHAQNTGWNTLTVAPTRDFNSSNGTTSTLNRSDAVFSYNSNLYGGVSRWYWQINTIPNAAPFGSIYVGNGDKFSLEFD